MNEVLEKANTNVQNALEDVGEVQFQITTIENFGELRFAIRVKSKTIENKCPNYSDSTNDCERCSFSGGWHLIEGRCVPKLYLRQAVIMAQHMERPDVKSRRAKVARKKSNKACHDRKLERDAEWV